MEDPAIQVTESPDFMDGKDHWLWMPDSFQKCQRHFFQDIKNSFHGVTQMGLEPHQHFFQNFLSTNMVAGGVQSFCILEGATDPLIE